MRINEVRAIVTGAASGLGRHFTLKLASLGASVAAGDIDVQGLDELKQECQVQAGRMTSSPGPICNAANAVCKAAVPDVTARAKRVCMRFAHSVSNVATFVGG